MDISSVSDAAAGKHRGCLPAVSTGVLAGAAALDLLILASNGDRLWPALIVLTLGLAALLWPPTRRPRRLTPSLRAAAPAATSLGYTAAVLLAGRPLAFGPAEPTILLCLLVVAVRACQPRSAAATAALLTIATVALPLRAGAGDLSRAGISYYAATLLAVLTASAITLGVFLRSQDRRRDAAVLDARRTERLSMAAELHDFVAHHVTGMLIQTQMARMLSRTDPDRLDPILEGIGHAAAETLHAMRRTVGILRSDTEMPPAGDLAALPDLIAGFQKTHGIPATLHHDPNLPDPLPPDVQAAAYRLVQESLTNVGRHAADATAVTIELRHDRRHLQVTIRDNGPDRPQQAATRSGGFGLLGLAERVDTLGGRLQAGPDPTGGWQVTARLPTGTTQTADTPGHHPA